MRAAVGDGADAVPTIRRRLPSFRGDRFGYTVSALPACDSGSESARRDRCDFRSLPAGIVESSL